MTKTSSITLFLVYCNMAVSKKQDTSIYWWYSGQWHIAELLLKHPDFDTKEVRKTNCKYRKNNLFVRSWNHVCPQAMQTNTRKLLSLRWIFEDLIFVSEMNIHCWCTVEDWIFQQWNSWWDTFTVSLIWVTSTSDARRFVVGTFQMLWTWKEGVRSGTRPCPTGGGSAGTWASMSWSVFLWTKRPIHFL